MNEWQSERLTDSSHQGSAQTLVRSEGLDKSFGTVVAANDVTFELRAGQILGLLGHNGAGKTTLIRMMAGLIEPDDGTIEVLGCHPILHGTDVRRRIGVLPSSATVDVRLTARENLEFVAGLFDIDTATGSQRSAELLERFGLSDRADDRVGTFSAGMKQRLALARVLLPEPELLLLDEPTSAMDPIAALEFLDLLASFAHDEESRAIVLCTHDLAEADRLCTDLIVLRHGTVIARGHPNELTGNVAAATIIEVDTRDEPRALAVLRIIDGQARVERGGHIVLPAIARSEIPPIIEQLVAQRIPVFSITRRTPSLEDIYLDLHSVGHHETEETS